MELLITNQILTEITVFDKFTKYNIQNNKKDWSEHMGFSFDISVPVLTVFFRD